MKKLIFRVVLVLVVLGLAYGGYRLLQQLPQRQQQVPTAKVRQGDVVIRTFARGELRAVRSAMLIAPNLFGTVQITRLAALGAFAKEKDLVAEFDDAEVRSRLEERQLEIDQLDEQLKKSQADLAIRNNSDQVELLRTRYSVRRAELEVKRAELKSEIDRRKDQLTLTEARQRLKQLESDIKSRLQQAEAELAVLRERRNRAVLELEREKTRLRQVKLLAPMSGLVAIRQSRPMGGMFFSGMQLPDYREGDQVYPGTPVADVLDLSELEVAAKVGELDRANLEEGQVVLMRLDAVPGKVFHGKIKSLSGTASANVWSGDPAKKFDVIFSVDMKELLTGLGAKPEQIKRVLETAEQNRKRPSSPSMMASSMFGMGGPPGGAMMIMQQGGAPGGMPGGMPGGAAGGGMMTMRMGAGGEGSEGGQRRAEGGGEGGQAGEGRRAGGMMRFGGNLSEEDQKKLREVMEKELAGRSMRDLSQEERQKIFAKIQEVVKLPAGAGRPGGTPGQPGAAGEGPRAASGESRVGLRPATEGERQGRRGSGEGGREGRGGQPGEGGEQPQMTRAFGFGGPQQFTEKDLEDAKLPPPPEEESQLEVLLRPGLLADVEIIVEKIPSAIHVPAQAVFEKDGKPVVYVMKEDTFELRQVRPLKRSESTMVIAEGLQAGEVVALSDPTARKSDKKQEQKPAGGGPSIPAGGGSRGGR
ncbi:MAG: HlyD family efflux transporter periplasmic adaptor subunit [Acidobacteria bacterium]|nr:HlyD family efflux transporter periplasmic adaptor subunit [Acidobacteriota bacterium]